MYTTYTLELHTDTSSKYINVLGTDIMDALRTAQHMFPSQLVTIPLDMYENAI